MPSFQTIKGFRDFFPEDCALRNFIFDRWRSTAAGHGFTEYEGPALESTDLYRKKSGDEIVHQLFCFTTKGDEDVSLRPEVTPSLARMAAARQRHYSKPMKWFQVGPCYRYERQQRGRLREFHQFNVDILGEASPAADAELIATAIASLRSFGLTKDDFAIRLSDRKLWAQFQAEAGIPEDRAGEFLQIIDKMERAAPEATDEKLQGLGTSLDAVRGFIGSVNENHPVFSAIRDSLAARGLWEFVKVDPGIVRGLAYYTGVVFEAFDLKHGLRAIAGGGRYDNLVSLLSDGGTDMPACGFAMGDVVLGELIKETPAAQQAVAAWMKRAGALDVFVVVADEARRGDALAIVQSLREAGWAADYPLTAQKMGRQFQQAEGARARLAVIVGAEFPTLLVKNLATRDQMEVPLDGLRARLAELFAAPEYRNLIA
jgi:histidyl-tRNA synthetase